MRVLYLIYSLITQTLKHRGSEDQRFGPFLIISLILQPVIFSILVVLLGSEHARLPIARTASTFYTRVSPWFYAAAGITILIAWQVFDRKRYEINCRFPSLEDTDIFKLRYLYILLAIVFAGLLTYLGDKNALLCIAVFLLMLLITNNMIRSAKGVRDN